MELDKNLKESASGVKELEQDEEKAPRGCEFKGSDLPQILCLLALLAQDILQLALTLFL
jgi:hypothetical protein